MTRTDYGSGPVLIANALIDLAFASAKQLGAATELPMGTIHPTLRRMAKAGYIEKLPAGVYVLRRHPDTGQTYTFQAQLTAEPVGETSADDATT